MLIQYLTFCLGAGLLQVAYVKQPKMAGGNPTDELNRMRAVLDSPLWFSGISAQIIVPILGLGAFIAEVVLGFMLVAWWAGVFLWIPALLVASIVIPSKNPAPSFFIGILVIAGSTISFLV